MAVLQNGVVWHQANMRTFLHKLMVDVTRQPRQIVTPGVDFEWDSGNSRIWQVFRAYEVIFGRHAGIRFEGSSWLENGKSYHKFGTWENLLVFTEHLVRNFFRLPKFEIVRLPIFALPNGGTMQSPFRFAIAFDASPAGVASATTLSCTVTGSNMYLMGSNYSGAGAGNANQFTAAFNSVAMTSSATQVWFPTTQVLNGVFLAGPSTGTNNLTSANNGAGLIASSYSGCAQTTIDQYVSAASSGGPSAPVTITATVTTSTANCWVAMFTVAAGNNPTASTNATIRSSGASGGQIPSSFDSNGNVATGSFSISAIYMAGGGVNNLGCVAYKFAQVTAVVVKSGFFFMVPH